jgi:hypothetical protein
VVVLPQSVASMLLISDIDHLVCDDTRNQVILASAWATGKLSIAHGCIPH